MRVVGFSAGATGKEGNVDRMVKAVLEGTGWYSQFYKLTDLGVSGCKGCVDLCAGPQVCVADDHLTPLFEDLKSADAMVLGSPAYFGGYTGTIYSFVERFFGYRHVSNAIAGKPCVAVMAGFRKDEHGGDRPFVDMLKRFGMNVVQSVYFCSTAPPCYYCGRHHECRIGGLFGQFGEEALCMKITPDMIRKWEDSPDAVAGIRRAVEELDNYDV